MAASFDAYSNNFGTGNASYSHDGGTPKGVLVYVQTTAGGSPSGVTYGGQALAQIDSAVVAAAGELANAGGTEQTAWLLAEGAPSGTQTVAVAGTASRLIHTITLNSGGGSLSGLIDSIIQTTGANPSTAFDLQGNTCFVSQIFATGHDTPAASALTGWTVRQQIVSIGTTCIGGCYTYDTVASANVTVGYTATSEDCLLTAVAVYEVPALSAGTATADLANGWLATATATDASGGTSPYTYQWQRSARGAASWANVTGQTTLNLVDRTVTASTNYDYRLQYTDADSAQVVSNTLEIDIPAQVPVWAILGDSDTDEYRADDDRGAGTTEAFVLNWIEQLATPNGASGDSVHDRAWDVGTWGTRAEPRRTGFANVWARSSATIDGMATQVSGAVGQIEAGTATHAVLQCPANDWHNGDLISSDIYNSADGGTTAQSGTAVATLVSTFVSEATDVIDALVAANVAGVGVVSPTNYLAYPQAAGSFPDATRRGYVASAFDSIFSQIATHATSINTAAGKTVVSVVEYDDRLAAVFATADGQFVTAAGVELDYTADQQANEGPLFTLVYTPSGTAHNGTILQGIYANTVLDAVNELPGISYALYTDAEIRANAGLPEEGALTSGADMGATFAATAASAASLTAGIQASEAFAGRAAAIASITEAMQAGDSDAAINAAVATLEGAIQSDDQYAALAQAAAAIQSGLEAGEEWAALAASEASILDGASLGATFVGDTQGAQTAALVAGTEAAAQFLGAVSAFALLTEGLTAADAFSAAAALSEAVTSGAEFGATFTIITGDTGSLAAGAQFQAVLSAVATSVGVTVDGVDFSEAFASVAVSLAALNAGVEFGAIFSASSSADLSIVGATASVRAIRAMSASVRAIRRKATIH